MGWLARAFAGGAVDQRSNSLSEPSTWLQEALGAASTASGESVSPDSATRLADVYACIRVLADAAGSLPLITYRRTQDGRERADDSLISRTLRSPSPYMTQSLFVSTLVAHLNGWGNAYIGKIRSNGALVDQLTLIHPQRVMVRLDAGEPVFRLAPSLMDEKNVGEFTRDDIIHVKQFSWDGVIGVSPIRQSREVIGTGIALEANAGRAAADGYMPRAFLRTAGKLSTETANSLKSQFRSALSSGGIPVLEEGLDVSPLLVAARDAQFVEQRRLNSTMIARIFRIPPYMIAADNGSSMTYSNVEQEAISFATHSLRPWLVAIEQALHADPDLFDPSGDLYPEFLIDAMLRSDTLSRFEAYSKALGGAAFMVPNEPRVRENLDEIPGGDVLPTQRPGMAKAGVGIETTPTTPVPVTEDAGGTVVPLVAARSEPADSN